MSVQRALQLLVWSYFASACVGNQNLDDGAGELSDAPDETQSQRGDAGRTLPRSEPAECEPAKGDTAQSEPAASDTAESEPAVPLTPAASDSSSVDSDPAVPSANPSVTHLPGTPPTPDPSLTPTPNPDDAGGAGSPLSPITESLADAGPSNPGGGSTAADSGAAAGAGNGGTADAGSVSTCEVDACNDHGTCIERGPGSLCDCAAAELPVCELPLFREIGPSRTGSELILAAISGDGRTLVGAHAPLGSPDPWVGVTWTLDDGLQYLAQHPAGPTVANSVNHDGSLIAGYVEPTSGGEPFDVIWHDGVLSLASEADSFTATNSPTPTVEELQALLDDAGIDASGWDIWNVNAASADGKTIFGLGLLPNRGARWLLRLP